jgi:hypothetical protein
MCPDPRFVLQSDVDPQLLVCIPFREAVKIQTITIASRDGGSLPPTPSSFLLSRALDLRQSVCTLYLMLSGFL